MEPTKLIHFDYYSLESTLYQPETTCEVITDKTKHAMFYEQIKNGRYCAPSFSSNITFIVVSQEKARSHKLSRVYFNEDQTLKLVFKKNYKDETCGDKIGLIVLFQKKITTLVEESIQGKPLSLMDKMWKKLGKAIEEHETDAPMMTLVEAKATPSPKDPLTFSEVYSSVSIGGRGHQEDSHLIYQDETMFLLGVFDGHSDQQKISKYSSENFEALFKEQLSQHPEDLPRAFKETMAKLDKQIQEAEMEGGATAVVSYIDRQTGLIYTATVGDSESKVFRKVNDSYATLPLSKVNNWSSYSERQRYVRISHVIQYAEKISKCSGSKNIMRLGRKMLNISRSLGDHRDYEGLISAKPEVTVAQLQPGDLILVGSDGCWDDLTDAEIVKILSSTENDSDVPRALTEDIIRRFPHDADNITVLGMRVK